MEASTRIIDGRCNRDFGNLYIPAESGSGT